MSSMKINRRRFIKGSAVGLSSAWLANTALRLEAQANGQTAPKRIILLVEGDALKPQRIIPPEALAALNKVRRDKGENRDIEVSNPYPMWKKYLNETPLVTQGITLTRALEPLTPYLDSLNIVQGLSNRIAGGGHTGDYGSLSSAKYHGREPGGETIDMRLARELGVQSAIDRLGLAAVEYRSFIGRGDKTREVVYGTSASHSLAPMPLWANPVSIHSKLFGLVASPETRQEFEIRQVLLDSALDDVRKVRASLGTQPKAYLDERLAVLEGLDARRSRLVSLEDALKQNAPELSDPYKSIHPLLRLEANAELAVAAMIAGLTNVSLLTSGCSTPEFSMTYSSIDPQIPGKHAFGHWSDFKGKPADYWLSEVHNRHAVCAARMIEKLKSVPEGDGTMWDNTLLVYTCDGGEAHHATFKDWIAVLVGGKNIKMQRDQGGRHILYPRHESDKHRQVSNLWNTLLHLMDRPVDDFGREGDLRITKGPLPELMG